MLQMCCVCVLAAAVLRGWYPAQKQVAAGDTDAGDQGAPHDAHGYAHYCAGRCVPGAAAGSLRGKECALRAVFAAMLLA